MWFPSSTWTRNTLSLNNEMEKKRTCKMGQCVQIFGDEEGLANLSRRLLTLQRAHQDGEQRLGPRSRESGTPTLCPARSFRWVSPAFIIRAVLCVLIANRRCQILTNGFLSFVALVAV